MRLVMRAQTCAVALRRAAMLPGNLLLLVGARNLARGPLWLLIAGALLIGGGPRQWHGAVQMLELAVSAAVLLRYFGAWLSQPAPFIHCPGVRVFESVDGAGRDCATATLHAAAFAVLLAHQYPELALLLWTFAALVAAAELVLAPRAVLDVFRSATLGSGLALLVLLLS